MPRRNRNVRERKQKRPCTKQTQQPRRASAFNYADKPEVQAEIAELKRQMALPPAWQPSDEHHS